VSFPNQNGHRFPGVPGAVPDLGALAQQQGPSADQFISQIREMVLACGGVQPKGPGEIVLSTGDVITGAGLDLFVLIIGPTVHIVCATIIDDLDVPHSIPWTQVVDIRPRIDLAQWVEQQQKAAGS
jgi:hypothetical protein